MKNERFLTLATWCLRLALGVSFLSAVADRFGLWGRNGAPRVAWGDWTHFCAYTAQLNWFLPKGLISPTAWTATLAETLLGLALILGVRLRLVALASAVLLALFAIAMVGALGIKAALDYSVFSAAGGAMLLSAISWQAPPRVAAAAVEHA
jgi:uncharacterized membrane protein YphA (DoxX/SURF4 family)